MQGNQIQNLPKATILSIIDDIKYEGFKESLCYFSCQSQDVLYDCSGILCSLFDLLIESHDESNNKPVIVYHKASGLPDTFINISKSYNDRNVIYIAPSNNTNCFVIFYFLSKQKKVLLIDPSYTERSIDFFKNPISSFLQKEGYSLYISNTEIQQDNYSCGPLISEITRMLYYNHKILEDLSSQSKIRKCTEENLEYNLIDIKHFLPQHQFDCLLNSFKTLGTVNYGIVEKELNGADFRIAHFIIVSIIGFGDIKNYALPKLPLTVGFGGIEYYALPKLPAEVREKYQHAKEIVEKIRSTFIGNLDNINLFNQEIGEWYKKSQLCSNKTIENLASQNNSTVLFEESDITHTPEKTKSEQSNIDSCKQVTKQKNLEWIKKYLEDGGDIDAVDSEDKTLLQYATDNSHFEIAVFLLNNGANVNTLNHYQKKLLLNHIRENQITIDLETANLLEQKRSEYNKRSDESSQYDSSDTDQFFSEGTVNQKLLEKNKRNLKLTIHSTKRDGNCFFHAVLGDSSSGTCKSEKVVEARREWHKFLSQFISLKDASMPNSLKEQLKKVFCFFLNNPKDLTNRSSVIKMLADKVNQDIENSKHEVDKLIKDIIEKFINNHGFRHEIYQIVLENRSKKNEELPRIQTLLNDASILKNEILNNLEDCVLKFYPDLTKEQYCKKYNSQMIADLFLESTDIYDNYLQAIKSSSYYIFFEEIPILAALADIKITVYYNDNGRYIFTIFEPNFQLLGAYVPDYELWGRKKEAVIYYESEHFSQASISQTHSVLTLDLENASGSQLQTTSSDVIIKIVMVSQPSSQQLQCVNKENRIGKQSYLRLHNAVKSGDIDKVRQLIENGYSVNKKDKYGITPLQLAADSGYKDIVKLLIKKGARVNETNNANIAPIHLAASNGHVNTVKLLIKYGADVNIQDEDEKTPLCFAVEYGHTKVIALLKENGAGVKVDNGKELISFHSINSSTTPLHNAVQSGDINKVKQLIADGYSVNEKDKDGRTPRNIAVENGHMNIFELLVNNGGDANITDNVHNTLGRTRLHNAAEYGDIDKVKELITNGVNIDIEDDVLTTPLHLAARNGHSQMATLLIRNKADINAQNLLGVTPLHLAAGNGHVNVVNILIKNRADIKEKDNNGREALDLATDTEIIELLLTENHGSGRIEKKPSSRIQKFHLTKTSHILPG